MRIAMPLAGGKLSPHFGHCEEFALVNVDPATKKVLSMNVVASPEHQPGLLPVWLAEQGATIIVAGGMGGRAQQIFSEHGISVVVGAGPDRPEVLAKQYVAGTLVSGENVCDH
jgi:predicted Fe-Mo cluster-binding NifX family protein